MMKYQEPEMDIITLESVNVITDSGETLYPTPAGGSGSGNWGGF